MSGFTFTFRALEGFTRSDHYTNPLAEGEEADKPSNSQNQQTDGEDKQSTVKTNATDTIKIQTITMRSATVGAAAALLLTGCATAIDLDLTSQGTRPVNIDLKP